MLLVTRRAVVGLAAAGLSAVLGSAGLGPAWLGSPVAAAPAPVTPQERAVMLVAPSVVHVEVRWEGWVRNPATGERWDDRMIAVATRCSGVTVSNDGYILTASQCVDSGSAALLAAFVENLVDRRVADGDLPANRAGATVDEVLANAALEGTREGDPLNRTVFIQRSPATPGLTTGDATDATVVVSYREPGISLLKVERANQPLAPLSAAALEPGAAIEALVLAYPAGQAEGGENGDEGGQVDVTVRPATVIAQAAPTSPPPTEEPVDVARPPLVVSAEGVEPTMAGAPVINLDGEVVGVLTLPPAPNPKIAADPSVLAEDFETHLVSNEPGEVDNDYWDGLADYLDGRYDDCVRHLDQVLAALPSHQQAQDLRQEAMLLREEERQAAPPQEPADRRWWYVGGVAVLLLIAAALVVARRFPRQFSRRS